MVFVLGVQKEMECQRHNAESTHLSLERKMKEMERELKTELKELQSDNSGLATNSFLSCLLLERYH